VRELRCPGCFHGITRTPLGGILQDLLGTAKTNFRACTIDSKRSDAFIVGCRCGVDLIDFTVVNIRIH